MFRTNLGVESLDDRIVPAHVGQGNFGNLISALNNINVQVLEDATFDDINIVYARDFLNGNNVEALNNALNRNNVEIVSLRDSINDNTVLTDFLNNNNISIDDVVSVNLLGGELDIVVFEG